MSVHTDCHNENLYTITFNGSDRILTTVTDSGAAVEEWLEDILNFHRRRLDRLVVGLDAEWRPSFTSDQNPVAVLQLCVGRRCLIFLLLHADYIPSALNDFLGDSRFTFFGVGVDGDVERLEDEKGLHVANSVDLRNLAADQMNRRDLKQKGLAGLALEVMGVNVVKPNRVRMSRWDNIYLTHDQIAYACVDAFLSFEIGRRLFAGEF